MMAIDRIAIVSVLAAVVVAVFAERGQAEPTMYERTYTMQLPLMKPGSVVNTLPGSAMGGVLKMPEGHIAIQR